MEKEEAKLNETVSHVAYIASRLPEDLLVAQSLEHLVLLHAVDTWPNGECLSNVNRCSCLPHQREANQQTQNKSAEHRRQAVHLYQRSQPASPLQ
jgi:hypothetical protein